jgi:hypothetical protein
MDAALRKVDGTGSRKVLSSRKITRLDCAKAKFAWLSGSALSFYRYVSYAASDSKEIRAQATLLVPSCGRK